MNLDQKIQLAQQLKLLGVSQDGIVDLLWKYPVERIAAQLAYLPYRKAKRPEALIVESIRKNYTPPKEFYYAQAKSELAAAFRALDEDPELGAGPASTSTLGHGTASAPDPDSADPGLAARLPEDGLDLSILDAPHR